MTYLMAVLHYKIEQADYQINVSDDNEFKFGEEETLSDEAHDITFHQPWYKKGYEVFDFLSEQEFADLKNGLTACVKKLIQEETNIDVTGFDLQSYHHFINTDEDHFKIVKRTRDLFPDDFNFHVQKVFSKFEEILGFKLSDIDNHSKEKLHIIIRINRPDSTDYNPPHKDIYEAVDNAGYVPQFLNFWIPVCGVTENSSLPMAPGSHLIPESKVERTFIGGVVEGNKYRVRAIKSWDGNNQFIRSKVNDGQFLVFTSHLIHGLAINSEKDQTRVALEFRLFKDN